MNWSLILISNDFNFDCVNSYKNPQNYMLNDFIADSVLFREVVCIIFDWNKFCVYWCKYIMIFIQVEMNIDVEVTKFHLSLLCSVVESLLFTGRRIAISVPVHNLWLKHVLIWCCFCWGSKIHYSLCSSGILRYYHWVCVVHEA